MFADGIEPLWHRRSRARNFSRTDLCRRVAVAALLFRRQAQTRCGICRSRSFLRCWYHSFWARMRPFGSNSTTGADDRGYNSKISGITANQEAQRRNPKLFRRTALSEDGEALRDGHRGSDTCDLGLSAVPPRWLL